MRSKLVLGRITEFLSLRQSALTKLILWTGVAAASGPLLRAANEPFQPHTRVSIKDGRWHISGEVTCPGSRAEGLLTNVRMVNAVFEDARRPDFDAEANTAEFIRRASSASC